MEKSKPNYKPFEGREDDLQKSCITLTRYKWPNKTIFHCPNGGKRDGREAHKFKQMGVLPGIPDVLCINPARVYNGCAIELKNKLVRLSDPQKQRMLNFTNANWHVRVVRSIDEFEDVFKWYFGK